ncbi:unnamed protein product [Wuchereria bancrofti]|uniref:Tryptophan synthase beta chain-like PALP domain-containing protein n=1 Tax=Wuchereria bancrofti TaxID=6293 RepID=A0A3P7G4H4_WUCBA|nr:unnamed protein product [Wuchereria bancrofti]
MVCNNLRDTGLHTEMVDPFDDYRVMAGQGTIAIEFLEQIPDLDVLLVAVGGGGLCSGIVTAAKKIKPNIKVYCVEPEGKNLQHSLDSNTRLWDPDAGPVKTIADGIRVLRIGKKCFPPISEKCEKKVLTVHSLDSNTRLWDPDAGPVKTIADGIRVLRIGKKCFPPISEKCEKKVLTVVSFITINLESLSFL